MKEIKEFNSGWQKGLVNIIKEIGILLVFVIKKIHIKRKNIMCEVTNVTDLDVLLVKSISDLKECVDVEIL
ncbi:MAG: hypothetical protein MUO21_00735 [Nitrososphaeraceae archaeon]|nr:hypothetical protein [Nitrososphaeraceae archaeon]